jgi:hypothetical protein
MCNINNLNWQEYPDKKGHWLFKLDIIPTVYNTSTGIMYCSFDILFSTNTDKSFDYYEYLYEKLPKFYVMNRNNGGTDFRRFLGGENVFKTKFKLIECVFIEEINF